MQQANEDLKRLLREEIEAAREVYMNYDEIVEEAAKESAEMDKALIKQAKRLLNSTQTILTNQSEIARLNGENFNVFRLLGLEEYEVKLHSPFITELLNPKGSHDQGPVFLEMFLQQVNLPENNRVKASKAIVYPERHIGRKSIKGDNSTGGRIDIFITDGTRHISIENKINSGEQDDYPITRYCNFEPYKNFVLFLTLEGDEAKTCRTNYKPISYRCHIIPWLENCHRHCVDLPILRETIKQYLHTTKSLTGGLIMQQTNENLKELMRKNIEAARMIYLNYDAVIDEVIREFAKKLKKQIRKDLNSDDWEIENTIEDSPDTSTNGKGLEITNSKWPDIGKIKWQYYNPYFEYGFLDPYLQFRDEIRKKLGEKVNELRFRPGNEWWAFLKLMDDNFRDDINALKKLFDEREQDELVEQVANELIDFIKACDHKLAN